MSTHQISELTRRLWFLSGALNTFCATAFFAGGHVAISAVFFALAARSAWKLWELSD